MIPDRLMRSINKEGALVGSGLSLYGKKEEGDGTELRGTRFVLELNVGPCSLVEELLVLVADISSVTAYTLLGAECTELSGERSREPRGNLRSSVSIVV